METNWQRYVDIASGLGQATQRGAEQVMKVLVKQGEAAADRAERAVEDLLGRSEQEQASRREQIRAEVEQAAERLGLVPRAELDRLAERVAALEARLGVEPGAEPAKPTRPARKTPAERRAAAAKRTAADAEAPVASEPAAKPKRPRSSSTAKRSAAATADGAAATPKPAGSTRPSRRKPPDSEVAKRAARPTGDADATS